MCAKEQMRDIEESPVYRQLHTNWKGGGDSARVLVAGIYYQGVGYEYHLPHTRLDAGYTGISRV
jgi:hypothetical protein